MIPSSVTFFRRSRAVFVPIDLWARQAWRLFSGWSGFSSTSPRSNLLAHRSIVASGNGGGAREGSRAHCRTLHGGEYAEGSGEYRSRAGRTGVVRLPEHQSRRGVAFGLQPDRDDPVSLSSVALASRRELSPGARLLRTF